MQPAAIDRPFFVVGTLERDAWRRGVSKPLATDDMLAALHDFLGYDNYKVVGGWQPQEPDQLRTRPR
jgi:hypothetical protein